MEKYGFVYIWYDRKHKRYYVGSHWGTENDGYICSSKWMYTARKRRPADFKRRIISRISSNRKDLLEEENRWLSMMKPSEMKSRYYNHIAKAYNHWSTDEKARVQVGQKITNANTGRKQNFKDPQERAKKISEGKKKNFAERGYTFTEEHREKLRNKKLGTVRTNEAKLKTSNSVKTSWNDPEIRLKRSIALKNSWTKRRESINNYTDQGILD